ncbi:hypothetical protein CLAIMM_09878 [Cladophialophora immunda]|nr:hypothetical protein CLAIMM_09878 [Cladophialophora immunda]
MSPQLQPGVYVATLTFFDPQSHGLDTPTLKKHIARLAAAGVTGIIALGSNGEAPHLSVEERKQVIRATKEALTAAGQKDAPVVVGASGQSVRETVALCKDAAEAGGSHVLILPPSYFKAAMTEDVIYNFYMAVAAESPLPIVLYSFPAVTAGIEMSSDLLIRISQGHPHIVGTKFTCADTGKLARVARAMSAMTATQPHKTYWAVAGLADFILQALVVGGSGVIAGGGNILPKTCCKVYNLFNEGRLDEAMKLQALLAEGDWPHTAAGIGATKNVLERFFGYGGLPRPPLEGPSTAASESLSTRMQEIIDFEMSL